jgi:hypothetical protein
MISHDEGRIVGRIYAGIVGDKSTVVIAQLLRYSISLMARVVLENSPRQAVHSIRVALIGVRHPGIQSVHLRVRAFELQVAQHVIKRAILHHQYDDVIYLLKVIVGTAGNKSNWSSSCSDALR